MERSAEGFEKTSSSRRWKSPVEIHVKLKYGVDLSKVSEEEKKKWVSRYYGDLQCDIYSKEIEMFINHYGTPEWEQYNSVRVTHVPENPEYFKKKEKILKKLEGWRRALLGKNNPDVYEPEAAMTAEMLYHVVKEGLEKEPPIELIGAYKLTRDWYFAFIAANFDARSKKYGLSHEKIAEEWMDIIYNLISRPGFYEDLRKYKKLGEIVEQVTKRNKEGTKAYIEEIKSDLKLPGAKSPEGETINFLDSPAVKWATILGTTALISLTASDFVGNMVLNNPELMESTYNYFLYNNPVAYMNPAKAAELTARTASGITAGLTAIIFLFGLDKLWEHIRKDKE